tara:strand:+ start:443 stop:808 length:366 start_codon:yes stop_codon:yes gene_type:complete
MTNYDYWDSDEFKFFNTLSDNDKLLYIYDLMISEFTDEVDLEYKTEYNSDVESTGKQYVAVSLNNGRVKISGPSFDVVNKISNLMMVNGMIFTDSAIDIDDDENVIMSFTIVGKSFPLSLN